jgi:hypothetical protein
VTEAEWLACEDPQVMLPSLPEGSTERKLRLFAVACCRNVWAFLTDESSRDAVEFAERQADEVVSEEDRKRVRDAAYHAHWLARTYPGDSGTRNVRTCATGAALLAIAQTHRAAMAAAESARALAHESGDIFATVFAQASRAQAILLREILGNPFRPLVFDPAWRTSDVLALATGIYDEKAFDRMPILADALQDAGCANDDILAHCRGEGPHVRGCWVADLVLEKG